MKNILRKLFLSILIIFMIILLGVGIFIFIHYESVNKPAHEIHLQGVIGQVDIKLDHYGIPHIDAKKSDLDVFYALGYMHAKDRFWQMEFQRRVASGRLSEIFGAKTLPEDQYLRTWGFYRATEADLKSLNKEEITVINAYTAGVNAYLKSGLLPLPFYLLRYKPEPWTAADSLCWEKMMAWNLSDKTDIKIKNYLVIKKYGLSMMDTIFPAYPDHAPTTLSTNDLQLAGLLPNNKTLATAVNRKIPSINTMTSESNSNSKTKPNAPSLAMQNAMSAVMHTHEMVRETLGFKTTPGKGSNAWVVAGRLTATGKPLLANDPHLALEAPSIWYQAELKGPHIHVMGATVPGLPLVAIGHNDHVAWGITSGFADAQDLYVEPVNAPLTRRQEIIKIRGEKPYILTVETSKHGPIISNVTNAKYLPAKVAIAWPALLPNDTTYQSFFLMNYAKNREDFVQALSLFVSPVINIVYADTAGNIGYYLVGHIPERQNWTGALPILPNENHEWVHFIPFEKLPHVFNPKEGFIVSANNQVIPKTYTYLLTSRWGTPPFRAARITALLRANLPLTVAKMTTIQNDTRSELWFALRPFLLKTMPQTVESAKGLSLLTQWNGWMDEESLAATVFAYWYQQLTTATSPVHLTMLPIERDPMLLINELRANRCHLSGRLSSCSSYLGYTLKLAMQKLVAEHGRDTNDWAWGNVHHVVFRELALGQEPTIAWLSNRSAPTPGGEFTVNVGTYDENFVQTHGPSYRQIIDLDNWNKSLYVIPLGANGDPLSHHYDDQLPLWLDGEYVPMIFK